jgi:hypothetical protein
MFCNRRCQFGVLLQNVKRAPVINLATGTEKQTLTDDLNLNHAHMKPFELKYQYTHKI